MDEKSEEELMGDALAESLNEQPEETQVTFTCVNKAMTLLLNDNVSKVKFKDGVYIAVGLMHIQDVRDAIKTSGYKARFNVVDKSIANNIIAKHREAIDAVAIVGAVGSHSDNVQGPGARAMAEVSMQDAGVDLESEAAKAVLNAIAPEPDQPVSDTDLKTEAVGIVNLGKAVSDQSGAKTSFFTKKD